MMRIIKTVLALGLLLPLQALATPVVIEGAASFEVTGTSVVIEVDQVTNQSSDTTSGTLFLALWATTTSSPVGSGYELAYVELGELSPNQYFYDIVKVTDFTPPPDGTYYIHLTLHEYPDLSTISDSVTFGQQVFESGGTGGDGGDGGDGGTGGGGGSGGATGLTIIGDAIPAYTADGYIAEVHFPGEQYSIGTVSIINERATSTGSLKVRVVASDERYTGGTLSGYRMADYDLPQSLGAGEHYADFVAYVSPLDTHPDFGQYYIYVLLMELDTDGEYKIVDYREWDGLSTLGCGATSDCLYDDSGDSSDDGGGGGPLGPLLLLVLAGAGLARRRCCFAK